MGIGTVISNKIDCLQGQAPSSLYVHIPFCKSRCFYCDFNTFVTPDQAMEDYLCRLQKELVMISHEADRPLQTIFFGGGTPTMFHVDQLERMLETIHGHFKLAENVEISLEANPGSASEDKLRALFRSGVNRLSVGAQSFNERHLMATGRLHGAEDVKRTVHVAKDIGISRINVDLMFGLPEQTLEDVQESIEQVAALDVEHVSAYWLIVEPGTPFAKWQAEGRLPLPGEDVEANMYEFVRSALTNAGYDHYETSNFAKPGGQARHNLVYWRNEPYFAAGAGAHGTVRNVRYENVKSLGDYGECLDKNQRPIAVNHDVTVLESMENTMIFGLRLAEGVSDERFHSRYGVSMRTVFGPIIDLLVKENLLEWDQFGTTVRIPSAAWSIANIVFEKFVAVGSDTMNG